MKQDLSSYSIEALQQIQAETERRLAESLLKGAAWEELREQRTVVTSIAKEIHHRKYPLSNTPADSPFRINYNKPNTGDIL